MKTGSPKPGPQLSKRKWALRKEELRALRYMQHLYIEYGKVAIKPEVFKRIRQLIETGEDAQ